MNETLTTVLSLTLSGSALALMLLAIKPLLKNRISKVAQYYLWLLVLLRLILPWTFDGSAMSQLFARIPTVPEVIADAGLTEQELPLQNNGSNSIKENASASTPLVPASTDAITQSPNPDDRVPSKPFDFVAFVRDYQTPIWLIGAALYFGWSVLAYLHFSRRIVQTCAMPHTADMEIFNRLRGRAHIRLFCNPYVDTPMLIGLTAPRIVIPQMAFVQNGMERELEMILLHELTHYRRKDLPVKWLTAAICALHWFNPLMVWMRHEIGRACELSCDEAVIRSLDAGGRQSYGDTLIGLAGNQRLSPGVVMTTLSEEKRALKERLVNVMNYKKKTGLAIALTLVLFLLMAGCAAALGASVQVVGAEVPAASHNPVAPAAPMASSAATPFVQTPPAVTDIPDGVTGVFQNWTSILVMNPDQEEGAFYGPMVAGRRSGNLLTLTRSAEDDYTHFRVLLETGDSEKAEYTFLASADSLNYLVSVQGADLDGDGTDELIINLDWLSSGGWIDTHVLTLKDGAFKEILTALNPDSGSDYDGSLLGQYADSTLLIKQTYCGGLRAIYGKDGRYALQMTWLYNPDIDYNSIIYNEFRYDGSGWTREYPENSPYIITPADKVQRVRELAGGIVLPPHATAYFWPVGDYANLDNAGVMDDMAYLHVLQEEDADERFFAVVLGYTYDDPGTPLRVVYPCNGSQSYYCGVADLDGNGLSEVTVVLGDLDGCEIHVLKPAGDTFDEVLTIVSNRPALESQYAATLMKLDIPWSWCNVITDAGQPMLELTSTDDRWHVKWDGSGWSMVD